MSSITRRRLRAPEADGAALIDPPLASAAAMIESNLVKADSWDHLSGVPLSKWRAMARDNLVRYCKNHARSALPLANQPHAAKPRSRLATRPFIVSGHQPTLFHPGVWLKNFLLSAVRERVDGAAVNLVIDNDASNHPGILVPTGTPEAPRVVQVPIDVPTDGVPWEERSIIDRGLFGSFPNRVKAAFTLRPPRLGRLLLDDVWAAAADLRTHRTDQYGDDSWGSNFFNLGDCLALSRHHIERELGLQTHEILLSTLLLWEPFASFVNHLFSRAKELREVYNASLKEFRLINRIRSQSHPVPELEIDSDWLEVPFWIWTRHDVRRRRAFVRKRNGSWQLSDRLGVTVSPGWNLADEDPKLAVRLRPRALITTMYARLVLSDLFIHGIGGAKYDELTDLIIRRFFGIEPPAYVTATATFRLPIERPNVSLDDVRASAQHIRELRYRPESFIRNERVKQDAHLAQKLADLAAQKREYLDQHDLRRCSQNVFDKLDAMNGAMHDLLQPVEEELRARHAELIELARLSRLLGSREFSFVLFPSEKLPARLLELSRGMA